MILYCTAPLAWCFTFASAKIRQGYRSDKQRKETLEKYQHTFLQVPKINDRKPVFISSDVRDRLDRIIRILGGRRMSVFGIIENIVRHHLNIYEEYFEAWRKL